MLVAWRWRRALPAACRKEKDWSQWWVGKKAGREDRGKATHCCVPPSFPLPTRTNQGVLMPASQANAARGEHEGGKPKWPTPRAARERQQAVRATHQKTRYHEATRRRSCAARRAWWGCPNASYTQGWRLQRHRHKQGETKEGSRGGGGHQWLGKACRVWQRPSLQADRGGGKTTTLPWILWWRRVHAHCGGLACL